MLAPVFGLGAATVADSRGPMLGALAMLAIGIPLLTVWLWRETLFRIAMLGSTALATGAVLYLIGSGDARVAGIIQSGLNIFRFTGGSDDIRAAFYASAWRF